MKEVQIGNRIILYRVSQENIDSQDIWNMQAETVGNVQALGANQMAAFSPKPHG